MLSTMKTLERADKVGVAAEKFEGKDVLKQVVIGALAVAPDGSSIVYMRRTVEDGKYARRLWRTTFEGGEMKKRMRSPKRASASVITARASSARPSCPRAAISVIWACAKFGVSRLACCATGIAASYSPAK